MVLGNGTATLVTGAGNGIGRGLSLSLASKGATVTVVEYSEADGLETVRLIEVEHAKLLKKPRAPSAIFIKCDVTVPEQLFRAFELHEQTYGRLDVCVNNAGIGEDQNFDADLSSDGKGKWRRTMDVNLSAVIDGTRLAVQTMRRTKQPGVIINVASAAGLYPSIAMPIYSASKAGVVMFSRSLGGLKREGIRVNALCPEFVDTALAKLVNPRVITNLGGYLPMDAILKGALQLIEDESKAGDTLWLTVRRGAEYWPTPEEKAKYELPRSRRIVRPLSKPIPPAIPDEYKKVIIHKLSSDFRTASKIVTVPLELPLKPGHVLVKNLYAGVNASDVNFSSGRYFGGKAKLPFDAGFEAVGVVASLGEGVDSNILVPGSPVATLTYGGFSEFCQVPFKNVIPMPVAVPELVALLTSGLTASLALEQAGRIKSGETVLVTAAAGGTGQFAVQLAKLAGNTVIATCGGEEKAKFLRSLGVDRVIDYKKESIKAVLKKEFPNGIDLIYESVGGEMFTTCLNALARRGRLIVIGMISQYQGENGWQPGNYPGLAEKILAKSQSVVGFFLNDYTRMWRDHAARLTKLYLDKKLKVTVDSKLFAGVEAIADAVEHLHSGQSLGKVVVRLAPETTNHAQARL
ncbi:prostaglandin reductase 3 [Marchantia polymorpha subsp. ruderalis]|uniref:Enoyl reductase (ER) domain-containing protein n=2 Tax=Marchantia polymorpha TaxID=3197 RepID=A0AAF6BYZ1_MARPO|nr:hypothetical protein MARPO_0003s0299 [Marchantia polymorpha]BBN17225.1 hypothetical protein Mp_7g12910 [Marchantia polymorpha subsp. ruderalis]|eukprot:PTQ49460.1 hypothetical protein MARPO_0003s0299 [Marchantia polymorpha]